MSDPGEAKVLQRLLLDMSEERSCDALLRLAAARLAEREHVALARIWLLRPGDICSTCPQRSECPTKVSCLHLVASAGRSRQDESTDWTRTNGRFRRFPVGRRKIGWIASQRAGLEIRNLAESPDWLADPGWARNEAIQGFAGQPLLFHGELMGVIAVFLRVPAIADQCRWLRLIANHLAVAITNARAFEQIEELRQQLELENAYLREELDETSAFGDIVGQSEAVRRLSSQIDLVAPTEATALITGESGTGKELVAREIHRRGERSRRPLIRVNCASIPRDLFESEFFGHVRGAFTGALRDRQGRFALADGGTLFLDEVGEIPLELQGKLLRVLQEGEFERVGEERTSRTDARVIAATNRDLKREVEAGRFREDLYYRLNVFPIEIAPLRERTEDIPPLVAHFVRVGATRLNVAEPRVTQATLLELQRYDWPGNVRELQNVIERGLITTRDGTLRVDVPGGRSRPAATSAPAVTDGTGDRILTDREIRELESENLRRALGQADGKVYGTGGAAELLGLRPTTLASRMKKLGLGRR